MNKRLLFILSMASLFAFAFVGCDETNADQEYSDQINVDQNIELRQLPTGYNFIWLVGKANITYPNLCDHKKCGMCQVYVEIIEIDLELPDPFQTSPILSDGDGNNFVEVLINSELIFDDEEKSLYIYEPIIEKASDGAVFILEAGVYPIDYELGNMGGYVLPLQKG